MHIFPFTMKVMPPNMLFSVTRGMCASAALTLSVKTSRGAIPVPTSGTVRCQNKSQTYNLAIPNREKLGNITLKPTPAGCLQLIASQRTGLCSLDDQVSHFYGLYHREEAFGRLEVGGLSCHLLQRAGETGKRHVVGQE